MITRNRNSSRDGARPIDLGDQDRQADVFGIEASLAGANFNPAKFDPLLYRLPMVAWAIFGTLTWKLASRRSDSSRSQWYRDYDFDGVLFKACKILGLRVKNLAIYWTTEFGAGECHIHFLIAAEGLKDVTPARFAQVFGQLWQDGYRPEGSRINGVGRAKVKPYEEAQGDKGVAYCLEREFDEVGRNRERYDYLSAKLKKTLRAAITQPMVTNVPPSHKMACSGRVVGQKFADFENANQGDPGQGNPSQAIPQPVETVVKCESQPTALEQSGLNIVVEIPLSERLEGLRR